MTHPDKKSGPVLPYGLTRDDLDEVDTDKLKQAMVKGVYLVEALLFSQAEHEASRLESTREVMDVLTASLYDTDKMTLTAQEGGYSLDTKIDLLKLAADMNKDRLKFLGELHRNVATGMEAVKSLERMKPEKGPLVDQPNRRKAVKEARRTLEDQMEKRVRELNAKVENNKK